MGGITVFYHTLRESCTTNRFIKQTFLIDYKEEAFQTIKNSVSQIPQLAHSDPQRRLCFQTDASDQSLCSVLFQEEGWMSLNIPDIY